MGKDAPKLARLQAMASMMTGGMWTPSGMDDLLADAWGLAPGTVRNDAAVAWLMVQDRGSMDGVAAAAVHTLLRSLDDDQELAERLRARLLTSIDSEESEGLKATSGAYKDVVSERNKAAELLAKIGGAMPTGSGTTVNIDARSLRLEQRAPEVRAVFEAAAKDPSQERVAALYAASNAKSPGELAAWLEQALADVQAHLSAMGETT